MITYTNSLENLQPFQLEGFFDGWLAKPSVETFLQTLHGSKFVWLALKNGQVVGFITAISDGIMFAFISLLEVHSSHQNQGIATELMRRMQETCKDLYALDTACDDELVPFYQRVGMTRGNAMYQRNYTPKYLE